MPYAKRYEAVWKDGRRLRRFHSLFEARGYAVKKGGYVRDLDAYRRILRTLR